MDLNPYQPPLVAVPTLADEQSAGDRRAPRPIGIWLLSGLHLPAGLVLLAGCVVFLWQLGFTDEERSAFPFWYVATVCGVLTVLALATAVGMWLGTHWGWWLTAFYYMWAVLGELAGNFYLIVTAESDDLRDFRWMSPARLIVLAIHALILAYLFKGTVRAFFRLQSLSALKALLLLGFVAIVVLAATYGATILLQSEQP